MEITLEKIELVKDRTGVSYKEAKEALEAAEGSVVDAIIQIEESIDVKTRSKLSEQSAAIVEKVKKAIKKGNVSKIIVRKGDDVMLNLPVSVSIIGSVLAPWAAVAGIIAIFGTKCTIELVKDNGEVVDISEIATDTFEDVVEKGAVIADEVKEKSGEVFESVKAKANDAINKAVKKEDSCDDDSDKCCGCGCEDKE
ncbi:DUF4342 domain-containing protein [Bacillota bacterium]